MSQFTTGFSPFLISLPPITNVANSATGYTASVNTNTSLLNSMINTSNYSGSFNSINSFSSGSNINITSGLNLSNVSLFNNGVQFLTSNVIFATPYFAVEVNNNEQARFTKSGLGVGLTEPLAKLDVNGSEIVRGSIYISSFGRPVTSTLGNMYADGKVFAHGFLSPSDPGLKRDFKPYISNDLPEAVEFIWRNNGQRDIGVNASTLKAIEPACVQTNQDGSLVVDYPKLTVLCLAEIKSLKTQVAELQSTVNAIYVRPI